MTKAVAGFDVSWQPLLLVALADDALHLRVTQKLREARVHFISVSRTDEAMAIHHAVGEQIVGVVTEHRTPSSVDGLSLMSALKEQGRALPALVIGSDARWSEVQLGKRLTSESNYLPSPFSDGAFSSRMEALTRWVKAAREADSSPSGRAGRGRHFQG